MVPPQLVHPDVTKSTKTTSTPPRCTAVTLRLQTICRPIPFCRLPNFYYKSGEYCVEKLLASVENDAIYTWTITKHKPSDVKLSSVWLCSSSEFRLSTPSVSVPFSLGTLSLADRGLTFVSARASTWQGFQRCDGLVSCLYNIFDLIWDSCLYQTNPNAGVMLTQSGHLVILA